MEPVHTHQGLTADMFVLRGSEFLILERAMGRGQGAYYLPGGMVEPGEDPLDAAVRETKEESGLDVRDAEIMRVWTFQGAEDWHTVHATFVGWSDDGDVVLSPEHSAFRWTSIDDYLAEWCSPELAAAFPEFAGFLQQVRQNCELVRGR